MLHMPPVTGTDLNTIPHYYGTYVRQLSLCGAALMLMTSPLYAEALRTEIPFEIVAAIIIVGLAAYTNPLKRWIFVADAVFAGSITLVYAYWALYEYQSSSLLAFVLRIAIAIIFLFAFYFSIKTLRSMILHEVGKPDEELEALVRQRQVEEEEEEKPDKSVLDEKKMPYNDDITDSDKYVGEDE